MDFTGYDRLIKNKKLIWLAVLPTIILILVWTNSYHGLIRYDVHLDESGLFPTIAKKYGVAFYIHAAYSYLLNMTAVVLLIRALFVKKSIYLKQTVILLIGSGLIIIPNMIYVFGLSPFKSDITPVFFGPAGIITMWAIFRYKLFELVPLARTTVIETMNVGVIVLDLIDKVIDMNPAFPRITGISSSQFYDISIDEVCSPIPELVEAYHNNLVHFEFTVHRQDKDNINEALFTPLRDKKGNLIGRMAVVYEITEKKQAQQEYLEHQRTLAGMEEKERLARDLHDNLAQLLGFINLQAQGISRELENAGIDMASDKLEQLAKVTQTAHSDIRQFIHEVRTAEKQEKNLTGEMSKIINLFKYQTGIGVNLRLPVIYRQQK
jgi:PAS domain S-box-containing protein